MGSEALSDSSGSTSDNGDIDTDMVLGSIWIDPGLIHVGDRVRVATGAEGTVVRALAGGVCVRLDARVDHAIVESVIVVVSVANVERIPE